MIEEPPVLTIQGNIRRPSKNQISAFQGVPVSIVSDALNGKGVLSASIGPLDGDNLSSSIAGPALTVDCGPADILALLASLKFIEPGDMVIAAFEGHQGCAVVGDRVTGMMKNSDAAGFISDGPVRDADGIKATGLPVWCMGLNPASPFSNGPGSVGFDIQVGGQQVAAGDMIVADRDGVVIVPFAKIDDTIEKVQHIQKLEHELDEEVVNGLKVPAAIEELLQSDKVKLL